MPGWARLGWPAQWAKFSARCARSTRCSERRKRRPRSAPVGAVRRIWRLPAAKIDAGPARLTRQGTPPGRLLRPDDRRAQHLSCKIAQARSDPLAAAFGGRRMHRSLPNPKARRSQHGAWQGFAALPGKCCGSTWPNGSPALPMMRATAENFSRRIPHSPRRSGSAMRRSPGSCRRWAFKPSRRPPTMRPPDWLGCRAPKACKPAQGNAFAKLAELDLRRG